jgi:hypothetical protein
LIAICWKVRLRAQRLILSGTAARRLGRRWGIRG